MRDRIKDLDIIEEAKLRILYFIQNANSADIAYHNNTNALANLKYNHLEMGDFFYSKNVTVFFEDKKGHVNGCFKEFKRNVLEF